MFKEIDDYAVRIHNSKKSSMEYAPNIISMNPIDQLFSATDWLVQEALKDLTLTHTGIDQRRKTEGYSQKSLDDIDELGIRLGSRTQGFVNQLCLMEDILIFEYERMAKIINHASGRKIHIDAKSDFKSLKDRLSPIRIFRNKVIAHTAYTQPRKEDNPETVIRSLLNLFPGEAKITLGDNFFSGFSPWRSQLPVISIFQWEEIYKPVFHDWKQLFIDRLEKIHDGCPITHSEFRIEVARPHLVRKAKLRS